MPVLLDREAACRGGSDDGLHIPRADHGHPRVDIAAHVIEAASLIAEMGTNGTATAGTGCIHSLDTRPIENTRSCDVDAGHHRRLRTALQHQHLVPMLAGWSRPRRRRTPRRHLVLERGR